MAEWRIASISIKAKTTQKTTKYYFQINFDSPEYLVNILFNRNNLGNCAGSFVIKTSV
jgi:hypothetical protein